MSRLSILGLMALWVCAAAHGVEASPIVVLAEQRFVEVDGVDLCQNNPPPDDPACTLDVYVSAHELDSATPGAPFTSSLSIANALASQTSSISASSIEAELFALTAEPDGGAARSFLEVEFSLEELTRLSLTYQVVPLPWNCACDLDLGDLRLFSGSGQILSVSGDTADVSWSSDQLRVSYADFGDYTEYSMEILLAPGTYTYLAAATGDRYEPDNFRASLVVPEAQLGLLLGLAGLVGGLGRRRRLRGRFSGV